MDELAKLYGHALSADKVDYDKLPGIFALKGRIQLFAPPSVVSVCEASVRYIMDLYMAPPASPEQARDAGSRAAGLDHGLRQGCQRRPERVPQRLTGRVLQGVRCKARGQPTSCA